MSQTVQRDPDLSPLHLADDPMTAAVNNLRATRESVRRTLARLHATHHEDGFISGPARRDMATATAKRLSRNARTLRNLADFLDELGASIELVASEPPCCSTVEHPDA